MSALNIVHKTLCIQTPCLPLQPSLFNCTPLTQAQRMLSVYAVATSASLNSFTSQTSAFFSDWNVNLLQPPRFLLSNFSSCFRTQLKYHFFRKVFLIPMPQSIPLSFNVLRIWWVPSNEGSYTLIFGISLYYFFLWKFLWVVAFLSGSFWIFWVEPLFTF